MEFVIEVKYIQNLTQEMLDLKYITVFKKRKMMERRITLRE